MKMGDVTADDIRLAIIPASKLSASVLEHVFNQWNGMTTK